MFIDHARILRDPVTRKPLQSIIFTKKNNQILDGLLVSTTDWYPVVGGIPRLLTGNLKLEFLKRHQDFISRYSKRIPKKFISSIPDTYFLSGSELHQVKTGNSFSYEWKNIYVENSVEKTNYLHFLKPYIREKDLKGKTILDAGCGSGRFTKQAAAMGSKLVVGLDIGDTVEVAYQISGHLRNVLIVQSDIYTLPFSGIFDLVHSIGVLHHLPNPSEGFIACTSVIKPGGKILIWVYNRRGNVRALYFYEPIRSITRLLPKSLLYKLCYFPAGIVHLINLATAKMSDPPFGYYRQFPFNMKLNDAFDVLATPKSNYYYVETIISWFKKAHLKSIKAFEHPEAGITCIGSK
jgi:2-polyprenyl-3-methyl-5-hydroxy-6-metoxy-1,4-benzoquinol methylase/uncharacterized protein YbaR (Trm112 family)